jgi:hypothetical protein
VLFSLVNFDTLEQLLTVACSDNIVTMENSTTDPLLCKLSVAAPSEADGDFFVLQPNLDSTAGCCFSKLVDILLNNPWSAAYSDQLPCAARRATTLLSCLEQTLGNGSAFPKTVSVTTDIVSLQFWISNVTFQPRQILDLVATTLCNPIFVWLRFSFPTLVFSCFYSNRSFNDVNFNWKCSIQALYRDSAEPYLRFVVGVSYAKLRLVYEKRLVGDLLKPERLKATCKARGLDDYNCNPLLRAGTALWQLEDSWPPRAYYNSG